MNLIRKYKISKITNIPLTGGEGEIIEFIHSWLKDLTPFKWNKRPDTIYFLNNKGEHVLAKIDDIIYIRWYNFWNILSEKYKLYNSDIQILFNLIIKDMVNYKFEGKYWFRWTQDIEVEEAYKNNELNKEI